MIHQSLSGLFTDYYSLAMAQGFFLARDKRRSVFEMFFRRCPFQGGFAIFAGLDTLLDRLRSFTFSEEDTAYLASLGPFREEFLSHLTSFSFQGDLYSVEEGTLVFPEEPLIQVHGTLLENLLIEGMLLNTINYQTLIATKASRIVHAAGGGGILEFGLRRGQGPDGVLSGSRAAYIGGVQATSNMLAGKMLHIPTKGTMSHAWVMSFDSEIEAFKAFARLYPHCPFFLIDTYDALRSGVESAIAFGREIGEEGGNFGVRIDSGDLHYLSREVRRRLDEAGLTQVPIAVSNDLNEEIITQLVANKAPIDLWGVGTELITGGRESSLTGVYKMIACEKAGRMVPSIKISNNVEKITTPGIKTICRFFDAEGSPLADLLSLWEEPIVAGRRYTFHHPLYAGDSFSLTSGDYVRIVDLLGKKMKEGQRLYPPAPLSSLQERTRVNLAALDPSYKRLINPHRYKVSLSQKLKTLKRSLIIKNSL